MSIRVKHIVQMQVSEDTDGKKKLFWRDETPSTAIIDTFTKSTTNVISVGVSSTDNLSLGDLTDVKGMYLELSGDAKVYLNGSTTALSLRVGTGTAKLFLEADINQVQVENESATEALSGVYCLWGS